MKQMKIIVVLGALVSFSDGQLIPRDSSESPETIQGTGSISASPKKKQSTVYTFSGPESASKILRLTGSHSSLKETSDSGGQSALSRLLHASTASTSVTKSPSSITASVPPSSDGSKKSASSTTPSTTSNAADHFGAPIVAGGIAAAAIAML